MKVKYLNYLDGIRGIAALMVMIFHFVPNNIPITNSSLIFKIQKIAIFGQTGVDLFFVLSGFLITRILISEKGGKYFFRNFYIRRTLRIFPLYYLFLIILFFIVPLFNSTTTKLSETWWFWIYLQNIPLTFNLPLDGPNHFWSLAVEEHFYLLWPLIVFFLNKKQLLKISLIIIIFSIIVRFIFIQNDIGVFYFTFCRLDALAFGTLLACYESENLFDNLKIFLKYSFPICLLFLIILWVFFSGLGDDWLQTFKFTFIGYIYFCVIAMLLIYDNQLLLKIKMVIESSFFKLLGKISYGLYVYHPFCFLIVNRYIFQKNKSFFVSMVLSFFLTFVISWLSYTFFESKLISLKDKFTFK